jgi:hypothetical protein
MPVTMRGKFFGTWVLDSGGIPHTNEVSWLSVLRGGPLFVGTYRSWKNARDEREGPGLLRLGSGT